MKTQLDILESLVETNDELKPKIIKKYNYTYTNSYKQLMFNCYSENRKIDSELIVNTEKDDNLCFEYIKPINKYIVSGNHNDKCLIYDKKPIPDYKIDINGEGKYTLYEKPIIKTYNGIDLFFTNIPKEIYLKSGYTHQHINYNSDTNTFFSYRKSLDEINEFVKNVYSNGLQSPFLMQVYEGNIYPVCMRIKYFSAYYLEIPSIPVCIIDGIKPFVIGKLEGNQNKEKLKELLYPYIIV